MRGDDAYAILKKKIEKNQTQPGATPEQAAQIQQNKEDITALKGEVDKKITKIYASSQGETHLEDSDNGPIQNMMLYGKSEQKQYSGKNLLNATFKTDTYSGVALTNNGDGTYTIEGTNNSSGELTFPLVPTVDEQKALYNSLIGKNVKFIVESGSTISGSVGRICFVFYNKTENRYSNETYNGGNVTVPTGYDLSVVDIHINVGQTVPKTIIKPMITTDLTATYDDFEPYTGGIPSPNPDYPQEIKSVVNPTMKVCGKNLLELPISNKSTQAGITFEVAKDSAIKITGINDGSRVSQYIAYNSQDVKYAKLIPYKNIAITISTYNDDVIAGLAYWLKSENYATVHYKQNKRKCTIDLGEDAKIVPWFFIPQNGTYTNDTVKFGVYYGTDELTYNAPKCQTVTLPYTLNAIPVSSGGNVTIDSQQYIADYVDVERGKRIQRIIKYKITGDESIYEHASGWIYCDTTLKLVTQICATNIAKTITEPNILSGNYIRSGTSGFYFTHNEVFTDINAFKNYVKNNDVYVYAVLQTPVEIDLTSEEVQALKALATYYPTTNISANSEQLEGYTVFNYPLPFEDEWNNVKQQVNDIKKDYLTKEDAKKEYQPKGDYPTKEETKEIIKAQTNHITFRINSEDKGLDLIYTE